MHANIDLRDKPILIFGNKIDKGESIGEEHRLRDRLDIDKDTTDKNKIGVFMISTLKGGSTEYLNGLRWLIVSIKYNKEREDNINARKSKRD